MIDFVSASKGGLEFITICETRIFGATVEKCAEIIAKQGLANRVMGSSSMDFADEYGFETADGASTMYREAIKLSGV
tara:strand:- start:178 stop:408 length:231 start_codon:yes stop_codon:yes gene_type:complete